MSGDCVDTVRFVDELLDAIEVGEEISVRLETDDALHVSAGGASARVVDGDVRGKIRSAVARLAVLLAESGGSTPLVYGGEVVADVRTSDGTIVVEAFFSNRGRDVWFRLRRAR
jgi:hypothetical protein